MIIIFSLSLVRCSKYWKSDGHQLITCQIVSSVVCLSYWGFDQSVIHGVQAEEASKLGERGIKCSGLLNTPNYHNSTSFRKVRWPLMWFYVSIIDHLHGCVTLPCVTTTVRAAPIVVGSCQGFCVECGWTGWGKKKKKKKRCSSLRFESTASYLSSDLHCVRRRTERESSEKFHLFLVIWENTTTTNNTLILTYETLHHNAILYSIKQDLKSMVNILPRAISGTAGMHHTVRDAQQLFDMWVPSLISHLHTYKILTANHWTSLVNKAPPFRVPF